MKKNILFTFVVFLLLGAFIIAQGIGDNPMTVSPGGETEVATVTQSCPTFSWSAVNQAASYRIVVFQNIEDYVLSFEDMATKSSPVISKDISGPALSWTLSSEESLQNGNTYVWYVKGKDTFGNTLGSWSNGRIFKVEHPATMADVEGKLGDILKSNGVSEEVITRTMKDLHSQVTNATTQGTQKKTTPQRSGVLGTEGASNTFYGFDAGSYTTGDYNSFFGRSAGFSNTSGWSNNFFGNSAGFGNTTGYYNNFIGNESGHYNTSGNSNNFFGYKSGIFNTTGSCNIFIGNKAGYNNSTGSSNLFLGYEAGILNSTGVGNNFIGYQAGYSNTIGQNNSYFGNFAGRSNIDGSNNVFLGNRAGFFETGSNKLYIANSEYGNPLIYGEFGNHIVTVNGKLGINTTTPGYTIEANTTGSNACLVVKRTDGATNYINATDAYANFGSTTNHPLRLIVNLAWKMILHPDSSLNMSNGASCTSGGVWTNASSRALKENIKNLENTEAIAALSQLNPVKYNYKADKTDSYVGFIAEDVPELVASADRKGLSPMDVTAVLTKVVQEQQLLIQEQQKINVELMKRIAEIEKQLKK